MLTVVTGAYSLGRLRRRGAPAPALPLFLQIARIQNVIDLHRVSAGRDVVGHHAMLIALDRRTHLVGGRQAVFAREIGSDPLGLVLNETDDAGDGLRETNEHQVVEAGDEDSFEQWQRVVRRRKEPRVEERERDVVAGRVDDCIEGFDCSVGELDPIPPELGHVGFDGDIPVADPLEEVARDRRMSG